MNDGHNIETLKVLIKRYHALAAGFARVDSYPNTDNFAAESLLMLAPLPLATEVAV